MSHEDTLLMIDAILAVAAACKGIAIVIAACTMARFVTDGLLSLVAAPRPR